jgi:HEAT repeat protein
MSSSRTSRYLAILLTGTSLGQAQTSWGEEATDHLQAAIEQLRSVNATDAVAAAERLGRSGDVRAVRHLVKALARRDRNVQVAAIRALGRLKADDDTTIAYLSTMLALGDAELRSVCYAALRAIEGEETTTSASAAAVEMSPQVRRLVVDLGSRFAAVRARAAHELAHCGADAFEAIDFLLDALHDTEYECNDDLGRRVSFYARDTLVSFDEPVIQPALARLEHDDPNHRAKAADILGVLRASVAVEPLISALEDPSQVVRDAAMGALSRLKDARALSPLLAVVDREPSRGRGMRAVAVIGELEPTPIEPLIDLLAHEKHTIREVAARELARHPDPRAIDPLLAALEDEHPRVQSAASKALTWIGEHRGAKPLLAAFGRKDLFHEVRECALRALAGHPDEVALMIEGLHDVDGNVQEYAVGRLRELKSPDVLDDLIESLKGSQYYRVRAEVARVLGELKDRRAVEPLIGALTDPVAMTRASAAAALGHIGDPRAIEQLLALLEDDQWDPRANAARALSRMDDPTVVPALLERLAHSEKATVRSSIAMALAYRPAPGVVEALLQALEEDDDPDVRKQAAIALGKQNDPRAILPLLKSLDDPSEEARDGASSALDAMGIPR